MSNFSSFIFQMALEGIAIVVKPYIMEDSNIVEITLYKINDGMRCSNLIDKVYLDRCREDCDSVLMDILVRLHDKLVGAGNG